MDNDQKAAFSLFISDLHLSEDRQDLVDAFTRYCHERAKSAERLYILGDLCDAWVGDDDDSPIADMIRTNLRFLISSGTKVSLMVGNRDFLMGEQLAKDCGIDLLADPTVVKLYGNNVLLLHGDSLCTDDDEYMAFRSQIQSPDTKALLMSQSLEERRLLAAELRQQSQSANASKTMDIMDVNNDAVLSSFSQNHVDTMFHGHTHRPKVHDYEINGTSSARYVLGDWDTNGWEIYADASMFKLQSFSLR